MCKLSDVCNFSNVMSTESLSQLFNTYRRSVMKLNRVQIQISISVPGKQRCIKLHFPGCILNMRKKTWLEGEEGKKWKKKNKRQKDRYTNGQTHQAAIGRSFSFSNILFFSRKIELEDIFQKEPVPQGRRERGQENSTGFCINSTLKSGMGGWRRRRRRRKRVDMIEEAQCQNFFKCRSS